MRTLCLRAVLLLILVLAAPAGAQTSEMPTELWSEYPLVQKVQRVQSVGPLLPPSDPEAAPVSSESTRWSLWLAFSALGLIALLFAARTALPVATAGIRAVGGSARRLRGRAVPRARTTPAPKPIQLREPSQHLPHARGRGRRAQYAPLPPVAVAEPDIEREPRRSVVRRTGFLRSRFVVVADEPGGKVRRVARSGSFWRFGGTGRAERAAEDAWSDLVDDLRAKGWEPDSTRPSDYYVLLRRVDAGPSAILPTIEAYTHTEPDES